MMGAGGRERFTVRERCGGVIRGSLQFELRRERAFDPRSGTGSLKFEPGGALILGLTE